MQILRTTLFMLVACQAAVSWGQSSDFITVETESQSCFGSFHVGQPTTLIVVDRLGNTDPPGITGAGFQVVGFPADWIVQATANPSASVVIGNPLAGGVEMAFASCQVHGLGDAVLLYTLLVLPLTEVGQFIVETRATSQAAYPHDYPIVTLCDGPSFTVRPVSCGMFWGNYTVCPCCAGKPLTSPCEALAVEGATWGRVKLLFR